MPSWGLVIGITTFLSAASEGKTNTWKEFSQSNPLDLNVNIGEAETYLVRLPCGDTIWFKLFLNGDGDQNSHIELYYRERGNIYCNEAGSKSWHGGERTDFRIYKGWECEDDGENMILEIEKTSQHVKLRNRGNTLYTKEFSSRDGNCMRQTDRVSTQVWQFVGTLYLLYYPTEEGYQPTKEEKESLAPGYIALIVAGVLVAVIGGVCFVRKNRKNSALQQINTCTEQVNSHAAAVSNSQPHNLKPSTDKNKVCETSFAGPAHVLSTENLPPPRYEDPEVRFGDDQVPSYEEVITNDHIYKMFVE